MPKAKQAARKALELDDSLADAHVAMAYLWPSRIAFARSQVLG